MIDAIWKEREIPSEVPNSILSAQVLQPKLFDEIPCLHEICERRRNLPLHTVIGNGLDLSDPASDPHYDEWKVVADKIVKAIEDKTPILVSGDYDVDGITATAILYYCLKLSGAEVKYFIPSRETDGYGVAADTLLEKHLSVPTLVITVDNGIKNVEEVQKLRDAGHTVIITDHHLGDITNLPKANSILDLKVTRDPEDEEYQASGCYVAAKLGLLVHQLRVGFDFELMNYAESLVALSIVSDIIELTPRMWHTLSYGLIALTNTSHAGLRSLFNIVGYKEGMGLTAKYLAFNIVPKLNSAGRMDSTQTALDLLLLDKDTSPGMTESLILANNLKALNTNRKIIERQHTQEALDLLQKYFPDPSKLPPVLIVYQPHWRRGLIGIMAARLVDALHIPVIVFTGSGKELSGSARAPENTDIYEALTTVKDLVVEYGGHRGAAGVHIEVAKLPEFKKRLIDYFTKHQNDPYTYEYDATVDISQIQDVRFGMFLNNIEPTGNGNPQLVLRLNNVHITHVDKKQDTTAFIVAELENKRNLYVTKYMADESWDDSLVGHECDVLIRANTSYFGGVTRPEWEMVAINDHTACEMKKDFDSKVNMFDDLVKDIPHDNTSK